jgi:hypothetical protein
VEIEGLQIKIYGDGAYAGRKTGYAPVIDGHFDETLRKYLLLFLGGR